MDWKVYFTKEQLRKANEIANRGRVFSPTRTRKDSFKTTIVDARRYVDVNITILPDKAPEDIKPFASRFIASCSCGAKEVCNHIAMALYAIDDTYGVDDITKDISEEKIYIEPFKEPVKIQYFNLKKITKSVKIEKQKYEKALQIINNNIISIADVHTGYSVGVTREFGLEVRGQNNKSNSYSRLELTINKDDIISHYCSGFGCNRYYYYDDEHSELCEHEIALLLLLDKELQEKEIGDYTDYYARTMIDSFHGKTLKERISEIKDNQEEIENKHIKKNTFQLAPKLEKSRDEFKASYKIGTDKMYVVKNLTEFVSQYEDGGAIKLGAKNMIDFSVTEVSEDSRDSFEFIKRQVKESLLDQRRMEKKARYAYGLPDITIKDSIPLGGEKLDDFFELYNGKNILFQNRDGINKEVSIKLAEKEPNFNVDLDKLEEKGQFLGITVKGKFPEVAEGEKYSYFTTEHHFNRTDKKKVEKIVPFLDYTRNGKLELTVGRNHIKDFYRNVLPVLEDALNVNKSYTEENEDYILPDAKFNFYLDAENGDISCRVESVYGNEKFEQLTMLKNQAGHEVRNIELEEEVFQEVVKFFPVLADDDKNFYCDKDENTIYRVLKYGINHLMLIGNVNATEELKNIKIKNTTKFKVGVSIDGDLLNLDILADDISREELLHILDSYKKKKKYYRLKNGDFIDIVDEELENLSDLFDELHISPKEFVKGKMQFPKYRALYLDKMLESQENIYTDRDKNFKKLVKEFKTVDESEFELPKSLEGTLRKYQEHGFRWMKTVATYGFGGILADDMGLGKTLQMIAVLLSDKEENGKSGCSLIICPASLVFNWREEFKKFAPELNVGMMTGTPSERKKLLAESSKYDVIVTSYDALKRDINMYEDYNFNYEIIDEAQYIKNYTTAVSKAVKLIKAKHRFALTGTPIENRLSELWSIFDFLMPGYLFSYDQFKKDIETQIVKHKDEYSSNRLKRMVAPFILRRIKSDVLKDLPEKLEEIRLAVFENEQKKLYDAQLLRLKDMIQTESDEDFNKNKIKVLAELTRIRQICCNPNLIFDNYKGESAKTTACMELIESAIEGNHKILVFSQFTSMLEILEKELKSRDINYYKITGETKKENRIEYVNQFNEDDTPVFLISLKAGGTGLNLTGADIVIHYDPWWNQAVQNQATDRAHRIGQTKTVSVYKLIVKDTIEEKILQLQEAKKNLADEILSGENGSLGSMSKEELMDLFC